MCTVYPNGRSRKNDIIWNFHFLKSVLFSMCTSIPRENKDQDIMFLNYCLTVLRLTTGSSILKINFITLTTLTMGTN